MSLQKDESAISTKFYQKKMNEQNIEQSSYKNGKERKGKSRVSQKQMNFVKTKRKRLLKVQGKGKSKNLGAGSHLLKKKK